MQIVIGSAWRSSEHNVPRYLNQVQALAEYVEPFDHEVRVIGVEGDSVDGTAYALARGGEQRNLEVEIAQIRQGTPHFGSVEDPARMVALSLVANLIFDQVTAEDDVLVYVESDLIWDAPTIAALAEMVYRCEEGFDVIAPLIFAGKAFYDIWAFRKNGMRFGPFYPYHPQLNPRGLTEVDSAGSCLIMRSEVAETARIRNGNALVGWCESARRLGFRIAAHCDYKVMHP